jgi:hypothetical protein
MNSGASKLRRPWARRRFLQALIQRKQRIPPQNPARFFNIHLQRPAQALSHIGLAHQRRRQFQPT